MLKYLLIVVLCLLKCSFCCEHLNEAGAEADATTREAPGARGALGDARNSLPLLVLSLLKILFWK